MQTQNLSPALISAVLLLLASILGVSASHAMAGTATAPGSGAGVLFQSDTVIQGDGEEKKLVEEEEEEPEC